MSNKIGLQNADGSGFADGQFLVVSAKSQKDIDVMEHPIEDGVDRADHIVRKNPTASMVIQPTPSSYSGLFGLLDAAANSASTFIVTTWGRILQNMLLTSIPEENPQGYAAPIPIALTFKQVVIFVPAFINVKQNRAKSKASVGDVTTTPVNKSFLASIVS